MLPGDLLYQFLAPQKRYFSSSILSPLRMWLPDTIVHCGRDGPLWLYSDRNGYIHRRKDFSRSLLIKKLGNMNYPDDIVVVHKEAMANPAPSTSKNPRFYFTGNNTRVINTHDVSEIGAQMESANTEDTFLIQRYIKCKGPQASILRGVVQRGKPAQAWSISNVSRFTDAFTKEDLREVERWRAEVALETQSEVKESQCLR